MKFSVTIPVLILALLACSTDALFIKPPLVAAPQYRGCYTDVGATRALPHSAMLLLPSIESCTAKCTSLGYSIAGLTASTDCRCGNALSPTAVQVADSMCSIPCLGNIFEKCGGFGKTSIFSKQAQLQPVPLPPSTTSATSTASSTSVAAPTSTSSSSTSTSTSTTSTSTATLTTSTESATSTSTSTTASATSTTSSTPAPTQTVFTPLGCFTDSADARGLDFTAYTGNSTNSVDGCALVCQGKGYRFSGTETGTDCYCGDFVLNGSYNAGPGQSGCTTTCAGNSDETCGGDSQIQIVRDTTWQQKTFTVAQSDRWTFSDCYADSGSRILNVNVYQGNSDSTVEGCLAACEQQGLTACGVQYSAECWGASQLPDSYYKAPSQGANDPLERGCNYACSGNSTQACGGYFRMNVYSFDPNATPVSPSTTLAITSD